MAPLLSVVIPAHNEADHLRALVPETAAVLASSLDFEIVVVDDASTDRTPEVLRDLQQSIPFLSIVRHRKQCGQSTALMTGIDAARGRIIATMDGDAQNDPADLIHMLDRYMSCLSNEGASAVICGHRVHRRDSKWRKVSSRIANKIRSVILRDATPDSGCGIKLFSREEFLRLPRFDHMHRFLPALFRRDGCRIVSVPVRHRPRLSGRSHYGTIGRTLAGIVDMLGVYWLNSRYRSTEAEREPTR
ncbi:MAG: glycosyltransferase family 2 protein [Planctomyces sp.]|nr:glycosyltransferase family 2 protein [Planctomyces sp.]